MSETFVCPRELEDGVDRSIHNFIPPTEWKDNHTCSYCGSLHPDEFFRRVEEGAEVGPTDKNYKVYVKPGYYKFYFQHLNAEQQKRFIDLVNSKKMNIGYPGRFYVPPFFAAIAQAH